MRCKKSILLGAAVILLSACGGGGSSSFTGAAATICVSTANDSVQTATDWTRIHSEDFISRYQAITLSRETQGVGPAIFMDYMVHQPLTTPKALLVLIAGGALDAGIESTDRIGSQPTSANGNFLVRSAHLFAARGYRVVTIDRPSDFQDFLNVDGTYDSYRTSMAHAVDLSQIINIENATDNLPVIIAGTSRGSISAVAQHALASAVAISAPLTSGSGTPIGFGNVLPANVTEPVHVSWHGLDECSVTTVANARALVNDFPDATGVEIGGGFAVVGANPCRANHYHGFPGIESCAVKQETDWMALELATSISATRPVASEVTDSTPIGMDKMISLNAAATGAGAGALTYSLPHTTTSLGGSISIAGEDVTYAPPAGVSGIIDTFVYVVNEAGGGSSHNLVEVSITP